MRHSRYLAYFWLPGHHKKGKSPHVEKTRSDSKKGYGAMICRDRAIVLQVRDFRETSKIALFFTQKFGKMSGILKGIRADPKKFASPLSILSINEIVFYKKRFSELHLISQCDLRKGFEAMNYDLTRNYAAHCCAELINAIMAVEDAHPEIYDLLLNTLASFENVAMQPKKMLSIFCLKTLSLSGFQPHLESCVLCLTPVAAQQAYFFSNRYGGLLCGRCRNADPHSDGMLAGTIATLLFIQKSGWSEAVKLQMIPSIERQLNSALVSFLHFHVEKRFKSLKILDDTFEHSLNSVEV